MQNPLITSSYLMMVLDSPAGLPRVHACLPFINGNGSSFLKPYGFVSDTNPSFFAGEKTEVKRSIVLVLVVVGFLRFISIPEGPALLSLYKPN